MRSWAAIEHRQWNIDFFLGHDVPFALGVALKAFMAFVMAFIAFMAFMAFIAFVIAAGEVAPGKGIWIHSASKLGQKFNVCMADSATHTDARQKHNLHGYANFDMQVTLFQPDTMDRVSGVVVGRE
jgi:hypothetical protein